MTPLIHAAAQGQPATAQLLVERGCDVDRRGPDGETALEFAIQESQGDGELVAIIGNRTTVSLMLLAASKVVFSDKLGPLVSRMAAENSDALLGGLRLSAEYGNSKLLKMQVFILIFETSFLNHLILGRHTCTLIGQNRIE